MKIKTPETISARLPPTGHEDYAVTLYSIERELKAVLEKVEGLKYSILSRDTGPEDLFASLAHDVKQFFTVDELAGIFKVDRRTVYGLRSQGLPSRRVGKELRFDPLEVAAWLKKKQRA
jgi:excisionase family DNA binding protein